VLHEFPCNVRKRVVQQNREEFRENNVGKLFKKILILQKLQLNWRKPNNKCLQK
jgi:hypothetical protein